MLTQDTREVNRLRGYDNVVNTYQKRYDDLFKRYVVVSRLVDEAHMRNGQYGHFINTFIERYPSQYADIVEEYKKGESI